MKRWIVLYLTCIFQFCCHCFSAVLPRKTLNNYSTIHSDMHVVLCFCVLHAVSTGGSSTGGTWTNTSSNGHHQAETAAVLPAGVSSAAARGQCVAALEGLHAALTLLRSAYCAVNGLVISNEINQS